MTYRVAIGCFGNVKQIGKKIKNIDLLIRALEEIMFAMFFILIIVTLMMKKVSLIIISEVISSILGEKIVKNNVCLYLVNKVLHKVYLGSYMVLGIVFKIIFSIFFLSKLIFTKNLDEKWTKKWIITGMNSLNTLSLLALVFCFKLAKWLIICGDVETNPGPNDTFKFMQWNCNSLPAHNFSRVPLIEAYSTLHKLHLMAISESALTLEHSDSKLKIEGYSFIRCDLPEGDTHGGC